MPKTKVEIFCTSNAHFLQRVYTGLRMLEQQGEVDLFPRYAQDRWSSLGFASLAWPMNLLVRINDAKLVLFDLNDNGEIWWEDLHRVDYYFKRSFCAQAIGPEQAYRKVFPFGLNYVTYERNPSWFSLQRIRLEKNAWQKLRAALKTLGWLRLFSGRLYRPTLENCQAEPDFSLPPAVIFMTRLWDPKKQSGIGREIAEANNAMRVACLRKLRQAWGPRFIGGLDPARYAYTPREFADCLVPHASWSAQGNYFQRLRQVPIAVDTRGLANSIGYKFAEYLAFSRAIVAEKQCFQAPGLAAGQHYLEFTTADECVEKVALLMNDEALRHKLMAASQAYYQHYLPADVAMRRMLSTVLAQA